MDRLIAPSTARGNAYRNFKEAENEKKKGLNVQGQLLSAQFKSSPLAVCFTMVSLRGLISPSFQ